MSDAPNSDGKVYGSLREVLDEHKAQMDRIEAKLDRQGSPAFIDIAAAEKAAKNEKGIMIVATGRVVNFKDGYWQVDGCYTQNEWQFANALHIALTLR